MRTGRLRRFGVAGVPGSRGDVMAFEPRWYRTVVRPEGLVGFRVVRAETDLMIHAERNLGPEALAEVVRLRGELEGYLATHPRFAESFVPVEVDATAPSIVREMAQAAAQAGVGPMAAVAGAFAEAVGRALMELSRHVVVENGGDVWLAGPSDRTIAVWSGDGPMATVGVRLPSSAMPCAVATSSATIGPSVSLGRARAATVIADGGAVADAAASAVGNRVHDASDIETGLELGSRIEGVRGVVIVVGEHLGAWGDIELRPVDPRVL